MVAGLVALFVALLPLLLLRVRVWWALRRRTQRTLAFLHPYCNDGGGGERMLWVTIRELLADSAVARWGRIVVYTGDAASDEAIRAHALSRFGVTIPPSVEFVRLRGRGWIEQKRYPVATLLGQAVGSALLAAEAIARAPPDVLIDTTGLHFCLPLLRCCGVRRLAVYVHYPIISSDMIGAVASRRRAHNNSRLFATSALGAALKLAYYRALAGAYRFAGRRSDATMANGSWTAGHLRALWGVEPSLVFPPCDTRRLQALPLAPALAAPPPGVVPSGAWGASEALPRGRLVLSVAQFRPEKDHAMQLRAFAILLRDWRRAGSPQPRPTLVVAGAVRHEDDARRLDELRALARGLVGEADRGGSVEGAVVFAPNLSLDELRRLLGAAAVGLHTMWNEHFGIGVVEMLAAGVATVAHRSGGPALDIIDEGATGMLATTDEEYAAAMARLLLEPGAEARRGAMAAAGRASVASRFSEEAFASGFKASVVPLLA